MSVPQTLCKGHYGERERERKRNVKGPASGRPGEQEEINGTTSRRTHQESRDLKNWDEEKTPQDRDYVGKETLGRYRRVVFSRRKEDRGRR